jgi:hypothetical protein
VAGRSSEVQAINRKSLHQYFSTLSRQFMKQWVCCIFIVSVLFAACTGSARKKWSPQEQETFIKTCVANVTESMGLEEANFYCECMMEKVEKKYPDARDADEKLTMSQSMEMAQGCLQLKPAGDTTQTK